MSAYSVTRDLREINLVAAGVHDGAKAVFMELAKTAENATMRKVWIRAARERHHLMLERKRAARDVNAALVKAACA